MADNVIKVVVVDKSPLVHSAFKQLFQDDDRFKLVAVCSDGERYMEAYGRFDFDVAVVGWIMSNGDGKFILDQMRGKDNPPRVMVYTGSAGESTVAGAMRHGAAAFVSKQEDTSYVLDTIEDVYKGRMVFPYVDVRKVNANPIQTLTRRELEVLSLLASGKTNKEVAVEQDVALNTIKFHVRNIYEKLSVRNRTQAISLYLKS